MQPRNKTQYCSSLNSKHKPRELSRIVLQIVKILRIACVAFYLTQIMIIKPDASKSRF